MISRPSTVEGRDCKPRKPKGKRVNTKMNKKEQNEEVVEAKGATAVATAVTRTTFRW